jgi:glucose dehydrogenase
METPTETRCTLPRAIARILACALCVAGATLFGRADDARPYTTWREYGGSADSMQYSALAQVDRSNVKRLERAWFYPVAGDPDRLPFNPIVVDDVMYVAGAKQAVVALDAATGKAL